ncbi:uncharacterized protein LOC113521998 [Galleria mellonella]|uniref:Uncharacterized protein LOC113521998 n=1 Tax=Galleria mellonella TaxID=7137 RepID=A0A6J1X260_GALME|nr:uncharacterized protein LOC113521998 [Galleria mellonella]
MYGILNSSFNRTYNPSGKQNALADIKRLLSSRDAIAQNKACGYLSEVIGRYNNNSIEQNRMVEYLLENDITVFLCEATSNLDFTLFRSILSCLRLLWRERRFFADEHAAHACTAVLRALAHYSGSCSSVAMNECLHFLCDLFNGINVHGTTSPLSHQSAYSTEQLLACFNGLASQISNNSKAVLSSVLVLRALVSYQPDTLAIRGHIASSLVEVLEKWLTLLLGELNHSVLLGSDDTGMFFVVACQLGLDILRLVKCLHGNRNKADFIEAILADEQEENVLKQCVCQMKRSIRNVILELVTFTKENEKLISTDEYSVFLKFLLNFFYDNSKCEELTDFCDILFAKGYLVLLPQVQIIRNDTTVRKLSTLLLGEMLKVLSDKYLNVDERGDEACSTVIHTGLIELQYGIEKPQDIGSHLQKSQPYSLLIYIYFYCQSSENPEEATAPLLPYLVEHILRLPRSFTPPAYIIKALWLVFAMSSISNGSLDSLDQRVYLEKATNRLVAMLHPEPSVYYTHNPAILLWAFTSQRIPNYVRLHVLSQWLQIEDSLPSELTNEPTVWEILLNILVQCKNRTILGNCIETLRLCLEDSEEDARQNFASLVWSMLPDVLARKLIDYNNEMDLNICNLLDLASTLIPLEVDQTLCLKIAVLLTTIFSKTFDSNEIESRHQYEYVCLKLCLYLLGLASNQNDNRVLLTYINRAGYLSSVLAATSSSNDRVACAALQLLSYVVYYYSKNNYKPKSVLQVQTDLIVKSLRQDSSNERGASLLQLVYIILNSDMSTPLILTYDTAESSQTHQCTALRALMFRVQLMLCCRESETQSSAGWKTLSSIFKHAILYKNDPRLVAILTSQAWIHILVQFQLTQNIKEEFLTFMQNWLTLLKITIKKSKEENKRQLCAQSLVIKTMILLKKKILLDDQMKEKKERVLMIVDDILDESGIRFTSD